MTRVLVTGAGGPAAICVIKTLRGEAGVEIVAADMDPYAAGLFLVPAEHRCLVPAGAAPEFTDHLLQRCRRFGIDVLVPTVDDEMLPVSARRDEFTATGVRVALTGDRALRDCLDKLALHDRCVDAVRTPRTVVWDGDLDPTTWKFPVIVKPRRGSGSRGIRVVDDPGQLGPTPIGTDWLIQEYLPGEEYSLDVLADVDGRVVSVVPRARLRVDSGVSVAGVSQHDDELDAFARNVFRAIGLTLVANVQCRRDDAGRPALLEVNPRFPGSMPLTIASGVNMPLLCLDAVLGRPLPASVSHVDTTMVRLLDEVFVDPADITRLTRDR